MKQIMWAIGLTVLLLAGPALPAEAAGGGGGGFRGGGSSMGGGGFRGGGAGAFHTGGSFHGGNFHGGHFHGGTRVFIGGGFGWWGPGWWGWPGWWGPSYPYYGYYGDYGYYGGAPVAVQQGPTEYIQQEPAPPSATQYWYYCQDTKAYYPYVKECPSRWIQVVPQPSPPAPPAQ
jgi:hypothetical protein